MSFLTVPLCPAQHSLTHPELTVAVEMLSSVALINRALESGDMNTVWKQLSSSVTGLTNIEEENCQRWGPRACVSGPLHGGYLCLLVSTPIFTPGFMSLYGDFIMSVQYRRRDILALLVPGLEPGPHTYGRIFYRCLPLQLGPLVCVSVFWMSPLLLELVS